MADFSKNNTTRTPFGRNEFRRSTRLELAESYTVSAAAQPNLYIDGNLKTVNNKVLTTNVATLTTSVPHGYLVGDTVRVAIGDAVFDGIRTITAVTSTTFSFERVNANVATVAASGTSSVGGDRNKVLQPGTVMAKITSGVEIGKVGAFQTGVADGRQTTSNIVGFNKTFLPWQLLERDVEIGVVYQQGALVQAWCIEYDVAGAPIPLSNTTRDAILALPQCKFIFK